MEEEGPTMTSGVSINNCLVNASCVAQNDSIYVFGGFHLFTDEVFDDLYILQHNVWRKVEYMKGLRPCKRCDHSATSWGQDRIVIFGGLDSNDVFLNDLHVLNLSTMTWTQPLMSGPIPTGRGKHSAIIEDGKLYVYGGWCASDTISNHLNILDLETFVWQAPIAVKPRHSHFSFLFRDALFVYGGISESLEPAAELLVLPLGTSTEGIPNQASAHQASSNNQNQTELVIHSSQSPGTLGQRFAQICGNVLVLLIVPSLCYRQSTLDPENALVRPSCGIWTLDLADCARLAWTQHAVDLLPETLASGEWHYFTMAKHCPTLYVLGINPGVSGVAREPVHHFGQNQQQEGVAVAGVSNLSPTNGLLPNDDAYLAAVLKLDLEFSTRGVVHTPVEKRLVQDMGLLFDAVNPSNVGPAVEIAARDAGMKTVSHDVEIQSQSGDSASVFAHRLVLLTRWSHYAAIERSGMYARSGGVIIVTMPERYETVRQLVKHFYTDALDRNLSVETLSTLLVLSNMYNLASLKRLATSDLYARLHASNATLVYVSALKSLSTTLAQTALKHMMTHFGAVVKSEGFRDMLKEDPQALDAFWKSVPLQSRVVAHGPHSKRREGSFRREAHLALQRYSEDVTDTGG
ncbi:hypothetical protein HDU77_003015 [Chytriomyces hyalinus]|nr:hypothetical protein HDU77_003015 [Chytriomyces hyalinus]